MTEHEKQPGTEGYASPNAARGALDERVRSVTSRLRWASRGQRTGAAVWPVPVALLAVLLIDASMPLPAIVRAAAGVLLVLLSVRVLLGLVPSRAVRRMRSEQAARMIEQRAGVAGNALINALQLRPLLAGEAGGAGVTGELARRAVSLGDERARGVSLKGLVDTRPVRKSWGAALGALLAVGAVWIASPRLFAMGVPRIMDPFGDHPAFTLTDFEIGWSPERVLAGDDVTVRVALSGRLPSMLDLVIVDGQGAPIDRAAMTAQPAGESASPSEYTAIVRDVRAPVRFRVEGDTGSSKRRVITPEMRPRIEAVELRVRPPAYTGLPEVAHTGSMLDEQRGPVGVLAGSTVALRVRTTMELVGVEQPGASVTAGAGVSGREALHEMRFDAPGERTLALRPVGVGGLACEQTATARVLVAADEPPTVRIEQPAPSGEVFVLEGAAFPVSGVAMDDVGVARFGLRWTRSRDGAEAGSGERAFGMASVLRSADGRVVITTADLGAESGDAVELTLVAWDARGDEFGGPQRGVSETVTVRVLDREEFARRFAEELTAERITRPYEELARATEQLDERAQDLRAEARELARDVERLGAGEPLPESMERSARALQERVEDFGAQRDALAEDIRRRLETPEAVEFDQRMREPLERLLERLESMDSPEVPGPGEPEAGDGSEQSDDATGPREEKGEQGEDQPSESPGQDQQLDRARVGQWLERLEQATEDDAQQAALASDEAEMDLSRPAAALELADRLQRTLEQVDDAARRQRMLADRLSTMTEADETAREELASRQEAIQAQIEQAVRDLRTLGDKAAHELGSDESPSALARSILDERSRVQAAIDRVGDAAARLPDDLAGQTVRDLVERSAGLVMDEVYRQTVPVTDALSGVESMPSRNDDEQAAALDPIINDIRGALQVLEQIEAYLEEAEQSYEETGGGSIAMRSVVDAVVIAALGAQPGEASSGTDADVKASLAEARLRIQRLRATLRQVETGLTPLLPKMGESAMGLAEGVVGSEAPGMMEESASALRHGDLTGATERALAAAEALEALYQDPGQGQPGQPGQQDIDQEMQLRKPGDPQQSQQSSGSSGSQGGQSMGGGQRPSTLDQLSQNRQRSGEQPGREPGQQQSPGGQQPGGSQGGAGGGRGTLGAGEPTAPGGEARAGDRAARERSRFFNEMLYEEAPESMREVDGAITEGGEGRPGAGIGSARSGGESSAGSSVPRGLTGAEAAAFVHVPEAYKDVVAAYFERIAREAAATGGE